MAVNTVELKTIKNTLPVAQQIVHRGHQFVLGGNDEQTFEADIADAFLRVCSPVVQEVVFDSGAQVTTNDGPQKLFVANMTGNPDAPLKVKDRRYDRNVMRWQEVEVDNPNRAPRTLSRVLDGGHKPYWTKDGGLVNLSPPSKTITIPPYKVVELDAAVAGWFMNRDSMSGASSRGAAILARRPPEFRPDMKWEINEMRLYAKMIDPDMNPGPDMDKLERDAKRNPDVLKEKVRLAKDTLLKRLHFKIVDPRYRLPTVSEFKELLASLTAPAPAPAPEAVPEDLPGLRPEA